MKKRRRIKKKPVAILICSIILIIVLTVFAIKTVQELNYRKTIDYKLLSIGYSQEEVDLLKRKTNEKFMNSLLTKEYDDMYLDILKEKYYLKEKVDDYVNYYEENLNSKAPDIVAICNAHAENGWYADIQNTDTSKGILMINNKIYKLPSDYEPDDLVDVKNWYAYGTNKLKEEAYNAFIEMFNAAKEDGIKIIINSAYRSYAEQEKVYNEMVEQKGQEYADNKAARPGHSEHETGLSIDVITPGATGDNFDQTEAFKWLQDHAHLYGFILRYPKDKEYLTGYQYESWHYRYVGIEAATVVHDSGITFDEYYTYYIENA